MVKVNNLYNLIYSKVVSQNQNHESLNEINILDTSMLCATEIFEPLEAHEQEINEESDTYIYITRMSVLDDIGLISECIDYLLDYYSEYFDLDVKGIKSSIIETL